VDYKRVFFITIRHLRNEKQSYILEDIYRLLFPDSETTSINIQVFFFHFWSTLHPLTKDIFIQVVYNAISHTIYQYELG